MNFLREFSRTLTFRFFAASFLLGVIQHLMIISYSDYPLTTKNLINISYGFAYDFAAAALFSLIFIFVFFLPLRVKKILAILIFWLLCFSLYTDLQYFYLFGTHTPFAEMQYFENIGDFSSTIFDVVSDIQFFIYTLLFPILFYFSLRKIEEEKKFFKNLGKHLVYFLILLVFGTLANVYSNIDFSKNFRDPVVSNGFNYLWSTFEEGGVVYYEKPEAGLKIVHELLTSGKSDDKHPAPIEYPLVRYEDYTECDQDVPKSITGKALCGKYAKEPPPNIIFLFLESFRTNELGAFGGEPSISKGFDTLAKEGILFKNFYANGPHTRSGQVAAYCSLMPNFNPAMSAMRRYLKNDYLCLPKVLKDLRYENAFVFASNADFDFQNVFFKNIGFDRIIDEAEFSSDSPTLGWGYSDEVFFDKMLEVPETLTQPFFLSGLTSTNHHPFDVPKEYQTGATSYPDKYLESMHYTSDQLFRYIREIQKEPWYENTIVFIFADSSATIRSRYHDYNYNRLDSEEKSDRRNHKEFLKVQFQIPLLILGGKVPPGIVDERYAGQIDLAPTLANILGMKGYTPWAGQSLLTPSKHEWAFANREDSYFALISKDLVSFAESNNGKYIFYQYGSEENPSLRKYYEAVSSGWIESQLWLLQENKIWNPDQKFPLSPVYQ